MHEEPIEPKRAIACLLVVKAIVVVDDAAANVVCHVRAHPIADIAIRRYVPRLRLSVAVRPASDLAPRIARALAEIREPRRPIVESMQLDELVEHIEAQGPRP